MPAPTQEPPPATPTDLVRKALTHATSPRTLAQGAGALAGLALFNLALAPPATVAPAAADRITATLMAGGGAVVGMMAHDWWSDQPIDYGYIRHRAGFVAGVAAAFGAAGLLGYELAAGADWLSWTAYRAALFGSGAGGAWVVDDLLTGP